jgi:hypothetical protein
MAAVHADHRPSNLLQKHRQSSEDVFRLVEGRNNYIDPVNNQ